MKTHIRGIHSEWYLNETHGALSSDTCVPDENARSKGSTNAHEEGNPFLNDGMEYGPPSSPRHTDTYLDKYAHIPILGGPAAM